MPTALHQTRYSASLSKALCFIRKVFAMQVTAWTNGQHHRTGAGYGFKLRAADRDRYFDKSWSTVFVALPGGSDEVEVNVSKTSFWSDTCRELISSEFGRWLRERGYAPWPSGKPPKFDLVAVRSNHFKLEAK